MNSETQPEEDPWVTVYRQALYMGYGDGVCEHPLRARRGIPAFEEVPFEHRRLDPQEWECGVCGTMQMRFVP